MISNFVTFGVVDSEKGEVKASKTRKSVTLRYPCSSTIICTPYKLTLYPGSYQFECWGARGTGRTSIILNGKGAYTKGLITFFSKTELYIYIGATGLFNSFNNTTALRWAFPGGGATDVRLEYNEDWSNIQSLKSRIMVAAGSGGSEWNDGFGGNGGELEGGESTYVSSDSTVLPGKCKGATQTNGSSCPQRGSMGFPHPGTFGVAGSFVSAGNDWGGLGGGGYYGGTSYDYSYAGSGGSSFISGHEGCKAIKRRDGPEIEHSEESLHYSGYVFSKTEMIAGNKTMPLPSGKRDIWSEVNGAFKITLVSFDQRTLRCHYHRYSSLFQ